MVAHIDNDSFAAEVLQADQPVLVDFWAPWCGPCRAMTPVIDELASSYEGLVRVVKVNVDDSPELATRYGVTSIPNMVLFRDGEIQNRLAGVVATDRLAEMIKPILK